MRLVKYSPQERVDIPDITAMSSLVLGEFRRHVRGILIGPPPVIGAAYRNFIIRGYAVEPQAVPDATVRVRLDPFGVGATPYSFAIGTENMGAVDDGGQLMGGKDIAGNFEGNATQTFDFTGQPSPAVYRVKMRFVYADGAVDNRAFWNALANTEYVAAEATRRLPTVELAIVGAGAEWIDLADVAWDGVSIDAGDITDVRTFAFEGAAPYSRPTQDGTGGMPNFNRAVARGTSGVNEVYPVLRALARQVQDLKGPNPATGEWDWFSQVFYPIGGVADLPAGAEQTKTLQSVDVVTYTVGDGTTVWGDFNGADGLEDALQALENLSPASLPRYVKLLLRSHAPAGFTWNINTSHVLGNTASKLLTLEIEGQGGGGTSFGTGVTLLNLDSVPGTETALTVRGKLILRNVGNDDATEPANNIGLFAADVIQAYDCRFFGRESDGASALPALRIYQGNGSSATLRMGGSHLRHCSWRGKIQIDPVGDDSDQAIGGLIEGCRTTNGCISFEAAATLRLQRFWQIRNCEIIMAAAHGWGEPGAVSLNNLERCVVEDCDITYVADVDGIYSRRGAASQNYVVVRNCRISSDGATATHGVDLGTHLTVGTGWGIYIEGTGGTPAGFMVEGCRFTGSSVDAGGIYATSIKNIFVRACHWGLNAPVNVASSRYNAILFDTINASDQGHAEISGCYIGEWSGTVPERTGGIVLDDVSNVIIAGNTIAGDDSAGSAITGRGTTNVALRFIGANHEGIVVNGNIFRDWEPNTDLNRCITFPGTNLIRPVFSANTFHENGGYCIEIDGALGASVHGNTVLVTGTNGRGFSVAAAPRSSVNDNVIEMTAGAARTGIEFGTASSNICMGNRMHTGTIADASGNNVWGVNLTMTTGNYLT